MTARPALDAALLADAFDARVFRIPGGCWAWTGQKAAKGYGAMFIGQGRVMRAHRFSWVLHHGTIPEGMNVCHRCDYRSCVNPEHLFLGTNADNNHDMARKGRVASREDNGQAKLTEQAIAHIRGSGENQRAVARLFGVNQSTISRVRTGTHWSS